jgi:outer membrane protein OmpA-like peptidoglycan-associated protein
LFAATLCAFFVAMLGCASPPKPLVCAAIGGVLGGGGGWLIGNETPAPDGKEEAIYGGAGAILGASTGYLICRAMQKEEAPPPPPPRAAPAPAPAPAPVPTEEKIVLRGVNFDFDKADIRPDAAVILDEAASLLGQSSGSVSVGGHTDSVGADAYNQGLSERRAAAVKDYLAGKGVDPSRLSTAGYGESNPIASNDTADGRALNRRVELNLE